MKRLIALALFGLLSGAASAQTYYPGTIYGYYPNGSPIFHPQTPLRAHIHLGDFGLSWSNYGWQAPNYYYGPNYPYYSYSTPYVWQQPYNSGLHFYFNPFRERHERHERYEHSRRWDRR